MFYIHLIQSVAMWANLAQPSEAFAPLVFEQRKRGQHQLHVAAQLWSVVDLDRVHMHMKVSDLLGNVWAPSAAVHTTASAPAAKWSAEGLEGKFCLDQSWIFVDDRFKEPLVQALSPLLTHPVMPSPHYCTCTLTWPCMHTLTLLSPSLVAFLSKPALINPSLLISAMKKCHINGMPPMLYCVPHSNMSLWGIDVVFLRVGQKDMVYSEKELAFLSKVHLCLCVLID